MAGINLPRRAKGAILLGGVVCTVVGSVVIWKDYLGGKTANVKKSGLKGKVFIITGANTGIGRSLAWNLAGLDAKVYMACRDMRKCEDTRREIVLGTQNKYVYCRTCDLSSLRSVREFTRQFCDNETRLDGLINNAGVMNHPRQLSEDGIEIHLAVNFLGHFLLTDLLVPLLRKSAPSRVVYLMNLDYRKGDVDFEDLNSQKSWTSSSAFYRSQLANMLVVRELGGTLSRQGVSVNAAYPGVVNTSIKRYMGVDKSILGTFVSNPLLWFFTKPPSRGCQTPLYLATDDGVSGISGKLFANLKEVEVSDNAKDETVMKKLVAVGKYWSGQVDSKQEALQVTKETK